MVDVLTSLHGGKAGLSPTNQFLLQNPHTGAMEPVASALHAGLASVAKNTVYDDFVNAVLDAGLWNALKGSDGSSAYPVIAVAKGGTVALVTSGAGASTMAVSGCELAGALTFYAVDGKLVYEAKVKISAITTASVFVGFTDSSSLEAAVNSAGSANTLTTTATDAVGFMLDTSMTAGTKWWAVGVAADVDATAQNTGITAVADTYNTLRVEVATDGSALFWIDGVLVTTKMTGAVTPTVALCPVLSIFERTTSARTLTADYVFASKDRA